jgi:hypothetical protein
MKKLIVIFAAFSVTVPVQAGILSGANLLKVANIVLKGKALLNKGQSQCGSQVALTSQDSLLMQAAGAAVQQALPAPKFSALDVLANKQASNASLSPTFCQTTAAKKPGILGSIGDAAAKLGVGGGALGGLGGLLGGSGSSTPTTGTTNPLGGLLGGN